MAQLCKRNGTASHAVVDTASCRRQLAQQAPCDPYTMALPVLHQPSRKEHKRADVQRDKQQTKKRKTTSRQKKQQAGFSWQGPNKHNTPYDLDNFALVLKNLQQKHSNKDLQQKHGVISTLRTSQSRACAEEPTPEAQQQDTVIIGVHAVTL
eukprot:1161907-Pelagomonas_calceolata.AAC.3